MPRRQQLSSALWAPPLVQTGGQSRGRRGIAPEIRETHGGAEPAPYIQRRSPLPTQGEDESVDLRITFRGWSSRGYSKAMIKPLGVVAELVRYPVKSMAGIAIESAFLGWHGFNGDRRFAFRREGEDGGFPWLT